MQEIKTNKIPVPDENNDNLSLSSLAQSSQAPVLLSVPENLDKSTFSIIPEDTARKYQLVPFAREKDLLSVAMVHPDNSEALNVLRFLAEKEHISIKIFLVTERVFFDIVKQYSGTEIALKEAIVSMKQGNEVINKQDGQRKTTENLQSFQNAPIATLVEVIIQHALEGRSSDIHIEPVEGNFRVRFRIDGVLHTQLILPIEVGRAVLSRIKILANLKIDEKRKPQDGRFRFEQKGEEPIDLRISSLPVIDGEKIVMRVLDKSANSANVEDLGLIGRNKVILEGHVREPNGIILITGPTGSGKTTTLYAFLQSLNQEDKNIVTLEDPVEYYVEGINQSQIKPEIGYTFASGLRSILRQDPNVIMVGEIRDVETAELAIHAALTGHLVFSTLHTNDAVGAIPRLIDMGIESFLLASTLQVVAAQRLVRRICTHCAEPITLTELQEERMQKLFDAVSIADKTAYGLDATQKMIFYKGNGCKECNESGYKGRVALYEVVEIDETIRTIISDKQGNETALYQATIEQGVTTMKQEGIMMALKKVTTLSEVERVTEGKILIDEE